MLWLTNVGQEKGIGDSVATVGGEKKVGCFNKLAFSPACSYVNTETNLDGRPINSSVIRKFQYAESPIDLLLQLNKVKQAMMNHQHHENNGYIIIDDEHI